MDDDDDDKVTVKIPVSDLPEALDVAAYAKTAHALIIDNKERQAARFLRYQRGCYLQAASQEDMRKDNLRKNLLGSLQYGTWFTISFGDFPCDLESIFDAEHFPRAALSRTEIFKEDVYGPLLRPEKGEAEPAEFLALDSMKMIFVTDKDPPQEGLAHAMEKMQVIKIANDRFDDSIADKLNEYCGNTPNYNRGDRHTYL